jgi:hypothetical protein
MKNSFSHQLSTQSGTLIRLSTIMTTSCDILNQVIIQPTEKSHYLRTCKSLLLSGIIKLLDINEARGFMVSYNKDTIIKTYLKWLASSTVTFAKETN